MRSVPVPCINCLKFHYNRCFKPPRQCWKCGQYGHIERFCPTRTRLPVEIGRGEPLPGTSRWCEIFGLNDDPELKRNVLLALKMSPGSSITINGRCIYRGGETHFTTRYVPKYSQTPEIRRRSRSRSPRQSRSQRVRSRSPLRRYSPDQTRDSYINERYRYNDPFSGDLYRSNPQDSPYRGNDGFRGRTTTSRTASPFRDRPRSPRYASDSNAIIFAPQVQEQNRSMLPPRIPSLPSTKVSQLPMSPRQALSETTTNLPPQTLAAPSAPPRVTLIRVEDPHFVLGIGRGASEVEVLDAFHQRMWELELERMSDSDNNPTFGDNIWDESMRILKEARRMLTGS